MKACPERFAAFLSAEIQKTATDRKMVEDVGGLVWEVAIAATERKFGENFFKKG